MSPTLSDGGLVPARVASVQGDQAPPSPRRPPSRPAQERVLEALVDLVDRLGYAHLTVQQIITGARVSRATFYQYFCSVEDCFWSAYRHHAALLSREIGATIGRGGARELAALDAMAAFAISRPAAARLLMREGLAAGPAGLIERERSVADIAHMIAGPQRERSMVDLPPVVLVGGAFRFLVMRMSAGSLDGALRDELREWGRAFPAAPSGPSWSERLTPALPGPCPRIVLSGLRRQGSVRERIIRATALAIRAKGYQSITVADIAGAAGVSRRGFYNEFPSKAGAFVAAYELVFQLQLAATAPAFFAERDWCERVWHAARAFTGFMAREPLLAYVGLVECYAIGPDFTLRVHDTQLAFTLFLEDGYRQRKRGETLPRAFSALTAATIFELAFQASRRGPRFDVRRVQPLAVYIALAPFIGPQDAGEFVTGKLAPADLEAPATA